MGVFYQTEHEAGPPDAASVWCVVVRGTRRRLCGMYGGQSCPVPTDPTRHPVDWDRTVTKPLLHLVRQRKNCLAFRPLLRRRGASFQQDRS